MKTPHQSPESVSLQRKAFMSLLIGVTLAFAFVIWPYFGAVFWGAVLAIVFAPLNRLLLRSQRPGTAAGITLGVIVVIVILPLTLLSVAVLQEIAAFYEMIKTGKIDFADYFLRIIALLPAWVTGLLERLGLSDLGLVQQKVVDALTKGSQAVAAQALSLGHDTLELVVGFFVMLYLLFFLLRDGAGLARRITQALPLAEQHKRMLGVKFIAVIRATVKGNVSVAALQGALGGLIFWLLDIHGPVLWGVVMAFLSLLPAIGAALVWGPVALYLLAIGEVWQGSVLVLFGMLVIGLVDNLLRPMLVGKDTRMPDFIVLISTLGGMALFGLNGFVIGPVIAAMFIVVWDIFTRAHAGTGRY
ncbi:MAG: AI-2E family transporter [Burkholderiaceae bacterium]|nr:AI-2E family transporter [Burkholderiaceae bacterium]MDO9089992.1 AI-2E family transporter [Burkholderiaceae bacterium]